MKQGGRDGTMLRGGALEGSRSGGLSAIRHRSRVRRRRERGHPRDGMPEELERSLNAITGEVLDAAIHVHKELGPGLLERAYQVCLKRTLEYRGLAVAKEVALPVTFEGEELDSYYRIDLLVEEAVPVELKASENVGPVHEAQLLTCLRMGGFPVGLLVNFHVTQLLDGVERIINPDR